MVETAAFYKFDLYQLDVINVSVLLTKQFFHGQVFTNLFCEYLAVGTPYAHPHCCFELCNHH